MELENLLSNALERPEHCLGNYPRVSLTSSSNNPAETLPGQGKRMPCEVEFKAFSLPRFCCFSLEIFCFPFKSYTSSITDNSQKVLLAVTTFPIPAKNV